MRAGSEPPFTEGDLISPLSFSSLFPLSPRQGSHCGHLCRKQQTEPGLGLQTTTERAALMDTRTGEGVERPGPEGCPELRDVRTA